jgi:hypothetical protein
LQVNVRIFRRASPEQRLAFALLLRPNVKVLLRFMRASSSADRGEESVAARERHDKSAC